MYRPYDVKDVFRVKEIYTAYDMKHNENYYFHGETHGFWELVIVIEGRIGVTAGSDVYILNKGQAILHEPMEFHRLWSEDNTSPRIVIFSFASDNMPSLLSRLFEIGDEDKILDIVHQFIDVLGTGFLHINEIERDKRTEFTIAIKEFEMFLLKTFRNKITEDITDKSKGAENYAIIINTLENNIDKCLSISEIARLCNMSEINLKKTFSRFSGVGIIKYFNRMKMTYAVALLEDGMSVMEAGERVGFYNQNYFSTAFKRIIGTAPSSYKPSKKK